MSVPSTVSEAIKILEERRKQKRSDSRSDTPVDILGVVVNQSILQSPAASSSTVVPKAELWIAEHSLTTNMAARVTLSGATEVARVAEEQITTGDILRFNRVSLGNNSTPASFQFVHLWDDPEPGYGWFRLGHIERNGSYTSEETKRRIPETMITSNSRVHELAEWFQQNRNESSNAKPLSPLPCQRRSLGEIQSSVGLVSNVLVKVTHYDCQVSPQSPAMRKRKRSSPGKQSLIGFSTITDGSAVMSFVDPGNRFGDTIRKAKETGRVLMLTYLTSKSQGSIDGRPMPAEEVVLFSTVATVALLMSDEHLIANGHISSSPDASETQVSNATKDHVACLSGILDFSIDGSSVKGDGSLESPSKFLESILTKAGDYGHATLRLASCTISTGQPTDDLIYAGPKVVKTLCGGVDACELRGDETLSRHVLGLFTAILYEPVLLRWTIDARHEQAEVVKVVLPRL